MSLSDWLIIIGVVVAAVVAGLYFLNRWASRKMGDRQSMIEKSKQEAMIFVIEKRHDYIKNVNLPKAVTSALPKYSNIMKMYFAQAKIGPKIMTLICEKNVFEALPVKKNVKVELSGMYISSVKGMKTESELKAARKAKTEKAKEKKKAEKQ